MRVKKTICIDGRLTNFNISFFVIEGRIYTNEILRDIQFKHLKTFTVCNDALKPY